MVSEPEEGIQTKGITAGCRKRATSEAIREESWAVVAEYSTDDCGELRPKEPTGGKAKLDRTLYWEELWERLCARKPYQRNPSGLCRVAKLCLKNRMP